MIICDSLYLTYQKCLSKYNTPNRHFSPLIFIIDVFPISSFFVSLLIMNSLLFLLYSKKKKKENIYAKAKIHFAYLIHFLKCNS